MFEIILIVFSDSVFTQIDEHFNGITLVTKGGSKALIKKQSGVKGFIITDHDYRNILDLATWIIILRDGCTKEIKSRNELIELGYIPETARKLLTYN